MTTTLSVNTEKALLNIKSDYTSLKKVAQALSSNLEAIYTSMKNAPAQENQNRHSFGFRRG